jgi:hypothetical protein
MTCHLLLCTDACMVKVFDFMTKTSAAILHPVAFRCHCTCGNEKRLHLHLGVGFAGNYIINKCRHMCFGQRFTWVTDYYAIKCIMSYDGCNPTILQLQMRFMCWDMEIKHRNNHFLTDADYWSCLGADLCFDPLLKEYIKQVNAMQLCNPSPTALPPAPKIYRTFGDPDYLPCPRNQRLTRLAILPKKFQHFPHPAVLQSLVYNIFKIIQFALAHYCNPWMGAHPRCDPFTFLMLLLPQASLPGLIGLSTVLITATLHPLSKSTDCPSTLSLLTIPLPTEGHYSRKSAHARQFCPLPHCFSIIFKALASPPPCVDILSIPTAILALCRPADSGRYIQILFSNCV